MTDIDIEQLKESAKALEEYRTHWDGCIYDHNQCAVLALIEQLESKERQLKWEEEFTNKYILRLHKAQTQRDRLRDQLGALVRDIEQQLACNGAVEVMPLAGVARLIKMLLGENKTDGL